MAQSRNTARPPPMQREYLFLQGVCVLINSPLHRVPTAPRCGAFDINTHASWFLVLSFRFCLPPFVSLPCPSRSFLPSFCCVYPRHFLPSPRSFPNARLCVAGGTECGLLRGLVDTNNTKGLSGCDVAHARRPGGCFCFGSGSLSVPRLPDYKYIADELRLPKLQGCDKIGSEGSDGSLLVPCSLLLLFVVVVVGFSLLACCFRSQRQSAGYPHILHRSFLPRLINRS